VVQLEGIVLQVEQLRFVHLRVADELQAVIADGALNSRASLDSCCRLRYTQGRSESGGLAKFSARSVEKAVMTARARQNATPFG
jgi:hypothetical protein